MNNIITKTVVYPNGDILDIVKVREALCSYWELNAAEQRSFDRLLSRHDLKNEWLQQNTGLDNDINSIQL